MLAASTNSSFNVYSDRLASELWVAVDDGENDEVRTLLQRGANPSHPLYWRKHWWNQQHEAMRWRRPPLHTACYYGNLEIIQMLVQAAANSNKGDGKYNTTSLHFACWGGQKDVAFYLIRQVGCKTGEFVL